MDASDIVPGDVLLVRLGDIVPADIKILGEEEEEGAEEAAAPMQVRHRTQIQSLHVGSTTSLYRSWARRRKRQRPCR